LCNGTGAVLPAVVFAISTVTEVTSGAWITILLLGVIVVIA
jgi:hypothetical protein